jgi:hypothetical protein
MRLLLGGDGEIQMTEEIVKVAARGNGKEIVLEPEHSRLVT